MTRFPKPLHEFQPSAAKLERSHVAAEDKAKLRAEDEPAKPYRVQLKRKKGWKMFYLK